ncbi:MAG: hypothetical protein CMP11_01920 [Zetaproteobacteria bacterium]|nr:hypothetical protein [Pseudobdellovibrionaceae bacterium]|tara:strand:- start:191 stop:1198 length:1008 start_codon:yes stop_codon:yes gene_type:complete
MFEENLIEICKNRKITLAFPESFDVRVLKAAWRILKDTIVEKVYLFGEKEKILSTADSHSIELAPYLSQIVWVSSEMPSLTSEFKRFLQNWHKTRKLDETTQEKIYISPLYLSAYLLREKLVDSVVSGAVYTSSEVIKAGLKILDLSPGSSTLSSSFLFHKSHRGFDEKFLFADCGVLVAPTAGQLLNIAKDTLRTWSLLPGHELKTPKIVFLSFSTKGSASHPSAEKMRQAREMFLNDHPEVICDGEMQFDAAFDPLIRSVKAPNSPIKGCADIFIFPNLDAGNIAYKIMQKCAGYKAWGPILQGFSRPYTDLSRGASVEDIIYSVCLNSLRVK